MKWIFYDETEADGPSYMARDEMGFAVSAESLSQKEVQLIAAAPKLLEALLAASDWIDAQLLVPRTEVQATIQQAVADATGRPFGHCVPEGWFAEPKTISPHFIQYRGYHSGPKDTGGMTSLFPSPEEALACAKACSFGGETAWVNPEFTGLMSTELRALEPIPFIDWKPTPIRKTIAAGETFVAGDLMVADHQVTRAVIGLWIVDGKVEVL